MLEPVPDAPAAVADFGDERGLVIADYHAGLEVSLRYDGVDLRSRAEKRRERLLELLAETRTDRLVVLGDLADAIGTPGDEERQELRTLLGAVTERVPVTVVKGNHDGAVETVVEGIEAANPVAVAPARGVTIGPVGFVHGHTWPAPEVLDAAVIGMGHEHPMVRLVDEVGGTRIERTWLRGGLDPAPFVDHDDDVDPGSVTGDLVVFPGFNDLLGGTWINTDQTFLAPYLPGGLRDGEAYLLDGTRLGAYETI